MADSLFHSHTQSSLTFKSEQIEFLKIKHTQIIQGVVGPFAPAYAHWTENRVRKLFTIWDLTQKLNKRPVTKQDEGGKHTLQAAVFKYPEMQDFSFKDMQDTLILSLV